MSPLDASLPKDLVAKVQAEVLLSRARNLGWSVTRDVMPGVVLLRRPDGEEAFVPTRAGFADAIQRLREAILLFAVWQNKAAREVLTELISGRSDIVRFRVTGALVGDIGSLPLPEAASLFDGCRRAFLSAAHTAIEPKSSYARLTRKDAAELVRNCTVAAERGSFVATVVCPLDLGDDTEIPSPAQTSFSQPWARPSTFGRKAVEMLIRAVNQLERANTPQLIEKLASESPEVTGLSSNLCDSLLAMAPDPELELEVEARPSDELPWDESLRLVTKLTKEHLGYLDALADQLRPASEKLRTRVMGRVDSLHGDATNDTETATGDIFVSTHHSDRFLQVRVTLGAADYAAACDAHLHCKAVSFIGDLQLKRGRGSFAQNVSEFKVLGA